MSTATARTRRCGPNPHRDLTRVFMVATLHHSTSKAILVSRTGNEKDARWLPKSQIRYRLKGCAYLVELPRCLARKKGFIA